MKRLLIVLVAIGVAANGASAEILKGSREHTRLKREVRKDQKQLLLQRQEVAEFSSLLREIESADPQETKRYYWKLSAQVRDAMDREYEQTQRRSKQRTTTQVAGAVPGMDVLNESDQTAAHNVSGQRADRMRLIMAEINGLEHAIANGDRDTRGRYHHLLAEFLGMMRAEAEDVSDEIAAKQNKLK